MTQATVIFPHQLFEPHPALRRDRPVYLVEDQLFFSDCLNPIRFHKQKLLFHRASLAAYGNLLNQRGYQLHYLKFAREERMTYLFNILQKDGIDELYAVDPVDATLESRLRKEAQTAAISLRFLETPGFLCTPEELREYFGAQPKFHQTKFYQEQRRRRHILMEGGKPVGGRWTFDTSNRQRLPRQIQIPAIPAVPDDTPDLTAAVQWVSSRFPDHPGALKNFIYPVTHAGAQHWLDDFLQHRLSRFGDYQDSISAQEPFLFHSVLSPLLNVGLLTPRHVIESTLAFAQEHPIPLNSLEGFIRQIVGWREYVRAVYLLIGDRQRHMNFWDHRRPLSRALYTGATGIDPVDTIIHRLIKSAYVHHIERLMVLGNFLLLCEIDPREVYRWFMEMFIDAYDWVMVPNVYGMSQFADGGLIMTKPYLSSSHYLLKMSDHPAGPWCRVWDGLYWRFVSRHQDYFARNPRLKPMVGMLARMDRTRLDDILDAAEEFLANLA
jgi:deoxyribodipyrimidine photolyase-related protein